MSIHSLLQEIFLTQGLNPGLPHCWQTLYHLRHQGIYICSILGCTKSYFRFSEPNFICILDPSFHPAPNTRLILLLVEAASIKVASLSSLGLPWIVSELHRAEGAEPSAPQHHSPVPRWDPLRGLCFHLSLVIRPSRPLLCSLLPLVSLLCFTL